MNLLACLDWRVETRLLLGKMTQEEEESRWKNRRISGSLLPTGTSRIHLQVKQFTWNLLNTSR